MKRESKYEELKSNLSKFLSRYSMGNQNEVRTIIKFKAPPRKNRPIPQLRRLGIDDHSLKFDKSRYVTSHVPTAGSGRLSVDIGDIVAKELRGNSLDEVYTKVTLWLNHLYRDVKEDDLRARYKHLTPGIQRMNLGNLVRGALKSPENKGVPIPEFRKEADNLSI